MNRLSALLLASSLATVTGCGGQIAADAADDSDSDSAALAQCGARNYREAVVHYERAIAGAKRRLTSSACDGDESTLWGIATEASYAIMTCGDVKAKIRTEAKAAPLRQALAVTLTGRALSGELLVLRDSRWQNWTGVESFLPGTSFWMEAPGAYGPPIHLAFGQGGQAVLDVQEVVAVSDTESDIRVATRRGSYSVERLGSAAEKRRIVVRYEDGRVDTYLLSVRDPLDPKDAPLFVLEPVAAGQDESGATLASLVGECDA
jgi:hypothetical protein